MSSPPPVPSSNRKRTMTLVGTGAVIVAAGFLLPQLLAPGDGAREKRVSPPANTVGAPSANFAEPGAELGLLTRLAVCTVAVLVLVPGALFLARRWLTRAAPSLPSPDLRVLGVTRIDRSSLVYLVEARGQRLLVGADWTGVKLLVPVPPVVQEE